jgi:prephenate dehydrogenase
MANGKWQKGPSARPDPCRQLALETRPRKLETPGVQWKKITLVGVGLLGGSLGMALRHRRLADAVVGYVRRPASVAECAHLGAVDRATCELTEAVAGAALVVLCTPLAQMRPLVERMLPSLAAGAIVTDVGSVKGTVLRDLEALIAQAGAHFIGGHPLAGAEKTGVASARADLFLNAVFVLTPTPRTHAPALAEVRQFWQLLGARLLEMPAEVHDELVSRSSHLPHVAAVQLASQVLDPQYPAVQAALCGSGFRDTTRIASSSPEMWRDIALANRENLVRALGTFLQGLRDFQDALRAGDQETVARFFETARQRREEWRERAL